MKGQKPSSNGKIVKMTKKANTKGTRKCSKCGGYRHNSRICQIQENDTSCTVESNESDVDLEKKN
jgi:hypothetical protein